MKGLYTVLTIIVLLIWASLILFFNQWNIELFGETAFIIFPFISLLLVATIAPSSWFGGIARSSSIRLMYIPFSAFIISAVVGVTFIEGFSFMNQYYILTGLAVLFALKVLAIATFKSEDIVNTNEEAAYNTFFILAIIIEAFSYFAWPVSTLVSLTLIFVLAKREYRLISS